MKDSADGAIPVIGVVLGICFIVGLVAGFPAAMGVLFALGVVGIFAVFIAAALDQGQ